MVAVKYTLDDFVHEMEDLLATQPNNEKIFDRGSDYLSRLIANPDAIPNGSAGPWAKAIAPITALGCCTTAPTADCWLPPSSGDPATTPLPTTIAPGA